MNILFFSLGIGTAVVIIFIIVMVVAMFKLNKKVVGLEGGVRTSQGNVDTAFQSIVETERNLTQLIEDKLRDSKSYTDSRIDKIKTI